MTVSACGLSVNRSGQTLLYSTDIHIEPGERVGLVGLSGSGKSTLGHALVDTLRTTGGSVAHVPQSPDEALDPLRTMGFQWQEAERALGLTEDIKRRSTLFKALGMNDRDLSKRPWGWSRGMQQRFVIAMGLMGTPDLLVMDEPTSALDPIVAADAMNLLDDTLANRSTALLLITHDLGLAARRVSRLMVMDSGRVVEDAPTQILLEQPQTKVAKTLTAHRNWLDLPC